MTECPSKASWDHKQELGEVIRLQRHCSWLVDRSMVRRGGSPWGWPARCLPSWLLPWLSLLQSPGLELFFLHQASLLGALPWSQPIMDQIPYKLWIEVHLSSLRLWVLSIVWWLEMELRHKQLHTDCLSKILKSGSWWDIFTLLFLAAHSQHAKTPSSQSMCECKKDEICTQDYSTSLEETCASKIASFINAAGKTGFLQVKY